MAPKPPPPVHMIDVSGASKTFGNVVAVSDVSFTLDAGVTALLGPNGAGKSTLFRMLCGLTTPTVGTVKVLGRDARKDTCAGKDRALTTTRRVIRQTHSV